MNNHKYSRKNGLIFLSTLTILINGISGVGWPTNIKRCTTNETSLDKCLYNAAKDAIPKIIHGNRDLGIIPLDPLKFFNMTIFSDRPGIKLDFVVPEGTIAGITDMKLNKISYDRNNKIFLIDAAFKRIKMSGNYKTKGRLFFLSLRSRGFFELITDNLEATHKVKLTPSRKQGYYNMELDYKVKKLDKMSINLQDSALLPAAVAALNDVVNDNWKRISDAFLPTMEKATSQIFKQALGQMFRKYPLATIFPDSL